MHFRQLYNVMDGRKNCLLNLYLDTVEEKILLVYFAG